jgi:hypothetical protein
MIIYCVSIFTRDKTLYKNTNMTEVTWRLAALNKAHWPTGKRAHDEQHLALIEGTCMIHPIIRQVASDSAATYPKNQT